MRADWQRRSSEATGNAAKLFALVEDCSLTVDVVADASDDDRSSERAAAGAIDAATIDERGIN